MNIYFNDTPVSTQSSTLDALMRERDLYEKKGVAVAVNHTVISKASWSETPLNENDKILVITATQGG